MIRGLVVGVLGMAWQGCGLTTLHVVAVPDPGTVQWEHAITDSVNAHDKRLDALEAQQRVTPAPPTVPQK